MDLLAWPVSVMAGRYFFTFPAIAWYLQAEFDFEGRIYYDKA